jgi:hypothetical protein
MRGEHAVAIALLDRRLAHGCYLVEQASALGILVEAHLARDDIDQARVAAGRLDVLADTHGHPQVVALAALAAAGLSAATGRLDDGRRQLKRPWTGSPILTFHWRRPASACNSLALSSMSILSLPSLRRRVPLLPLTGLVRPEMRMRRLRCSVS